MDETEHLHAAIWFETAYQSVNVKCFDIDGYHPNISDKGIKSRRAVLAYLTKEDIEPLEYNIDIKAEQQARQDKTKIIGKRLMTGESTLIEELDNGNIPLC